MVGAVSFKDDGPSITANATTATLTVDETTLLTDASASFDASTAFTSSFGADGAGTKTYALAVTAGASGLVDTATNEAVNLSLVSGHVEGRTATTNLLVFRVDVDAAGTVMVSVEGSQTWQVIFTWCGPGESWSRCSDSASGLRGPPSTWT